MSTKTDRWVLRVTSRFLDRMRRRARALAAYTLKNDELPFARSVERHKTNFWLYRSNQQRLCGDFVAVDMSSPRPDGRRVWVLELKRGARVRVGGGGAGNQLINAARAVAAVARLDGVIPEDAGYELVTGDSTALLARWNAPTPG